ncbi:aldo/keto reductase [Oribacterium sp. HCP28S3_H8]|uniref:aldo/keto reductase n=1 Tax=Oribacterium sp. HCP28S3_H8 TaxID=3438945 RepID=UPI003F8B7077
METFTLNNGVKMPVIGIGTFLMDPDHAEQAVYDALKSGYRMIDTANGYMNEKAVGCGMKKSGVDRKDIFLSTKLWPSVYEDPNAVDDTLRRLGTDYVDLLFIHQPSGNWEAGYRQLEKALKDGKARAIGISNFHDEKLAKLLEVSEVKPHVMQYENHPYYTADDVRKALAPFNVRFMAWYPLGHGDKSLQREPVFTELGRKYGKSPAQVILRWHVQFGNVVIPGSTNPDHIRANADIFDFTLTDEEMDEIAKIKKNIRYYNGSAAQEESYAQMRPDFDSQK